MAASRERTHIRLVLLRMLATIATLLAAVFPLTPGFSAATP